MPRNPHQRVTDTLNFLQNTTLVSPVTRGVVVQMVQAFLQARYPNNVQSPGYQAFSNQMSLGYHHDDDPDERRRMARALFLVWTAMHHHDNGFGMPLATIGQIDQARVERHLQAYMRKARCIQDTINNSPAGAGRVLAKLRTRPLRFLKYNKLIVFGSGAINLGGPQNPQPAQLRYESTRDRYEILVGHPLRQGAAAMQVESVTAFHWTDPRYVAPLAPVAPHNINNTNFTGLTGIQLGGLNLMVTTQFTGCAFCFAVHAGFMYCAHVSPAGVPGMGPNTDGTTLAGRILDPLNPGQFQNAGNVQVSVYGRGRGSPPNGAGYNLLGGGGGNAYYMTVIGVPSGGNYRLYSQTTMNDSIHARTRIH